MGQAQRAGSQAGCELGCSPTAPSLCKAPGCLLARHRSPLPKPIPESATLPTGTCFLQAMCPSTEKMAKPAKKLVQQFPMAMTKVSLPGRASQPHAHGVKMEMGASQWAAQSHGAQTSPSLPCSSPAMAATRGCPNSPRPPRAPRPGPAHRMTLLSNLL